ncbi:MAG TPA: hypothetical protein PK256_11685, partial [Verrucomicrobiota bacterium]|nr:hypothetical protein [Verrucomicrobiota bacterium]
MKNSLRFPKTIACLIGAMALFETARAATVTLPSDAAAPPGSASNPGFLVRSVQAPPDAIVANNILRAVKQLNGTLTDADGAPVPNEAIAGPNIDGSYNVDLINFEKDGAEIPVLDDQGAELAYFFPVPFPGIPGAGAHAVAATEPRHGAG